MIVASSSESVPSLDIKSSMHIWIYVFMFNDLIAQKIRNSKNGKGLMIGPLSSDSVPSPATRSSVPYLDIAIYGKGCNYQNISTVFIRI